MDIRIAVIPGVSAHSHEEKKNRAACHISFLRRQLELCSLQFLAQALLPTLIGHRVEHDAGQVGREFKVRECDVRLVIEDENIFPPQAPIEETQLEDYVLARTKL